MKKFIQLLCVFNVMFSLSCSTSHHKNQNALKPTPIQKTSRVLAMDQKRRGQEELAQDKEDRRRLLQRKSQMGLQFSAHPQTPKVSLQLSAAPEKNISEDQLYSEIFQRYERNDEIGFKSRLQMLLRKYPDSARADEALYMAGMMAVANKNYGPALKYFNQVLTKYPYSNKANSSLFAKGAVYKKMHLDSLAKETFERVVSHYPGSPEAFRAQNELRLIR
jgi:TolA-binding protein